MPLTYNGESFTVVEGPAIRAETHDWFEVSGDATSEYRLTELDQAAPKGRYRWRVEDDILRIQKQTEAETEAVAASWKTFVSIDADGVTLDAQNEDQSILLQVLLMYVKDVREMLELALEDS